MLAEVGLLFHHESCLLVRAEVRPLQAEVRLLPHHESCLLVRAEVRLLFHHEGLQCAALLVPLFGECVMVLARTKPYLQH